MKSRYLLIIYSIPFLVFCFSMYKLQTNDLDLAMTDLLKYSARISFFLFFTAFSASALNKVFKSKFSKWILQYRQHFGIAFAINHLVHFGLLIIAETTDNPILSVRTTVSMIGGTITYLFIVLMLITSFDFLKQKISVKVWKKIHLTGGYIILLSFTLAYVKHSINDYYYLPLLTLSIIIWTLRFTKTKISEIKFGSN